MTEEEPIAKALKLLTESEQELAAALTSEKTRVRGDLTRKLHDVRRRLYPDRYRYVSQAGQDAIVDRLFRSKRGGTFVDVGGYDGFTGSNSYFFEAWRGWSGVLVEPVPAQLAKAKADRRCPCLGLAVAASNGSADFIEVQQGYTQMSGLADSYDPSLLATVRDRESHAEQTIKVETRRLSDLLTDQGIEHPDFISLDIEGGEIDVLSDFPFDRHRVAVWAIENNTGTPEIPRIMRAAGYELTEFCGPDEIWRKDDLLPAFET